MLELKRAGIPIVVAGCNVNSGVIDEAGMDRLLKDLDAEQIDIVAPGNDAGPSFNLDDARVFPVTYTRQYPTSSRLLLPTRGGERLSPGSSIGPNTLSLVAPGINVKTISILNPNESSSMSGSSSVTQQIAAAYALVRVYREPNSAKARFILKYTARMFPERESKLKATPGNTDDAGRMAGRIDVYDALTMEVGCPSQSSAIMIVSKRDSTRAITVDSVLWTTGPFSGY